LQHKQATLKSGKIHNIILIKSKQELKAEYISSIIKDMNKEGAGMKN